MENSPELVVVIMAGGAGTRFWPASTEARPKQFLTLFGERSLLQGSYDRVRDLVPPERVLVLTNVRFVNLVRQQLPEIPPANVVGEPMRRDTAAAVALAALLARHLYGDPVMAVLTADHLIEPVALFHKTLLSAARGAADGSKALYTFGIQPTHPATGYGYLKRAERVADDDGIEHYRLARFVEKPLRPQAEQYLAEGDYFWNSGMFVWQTSTILAQFAKHLPGHIRHLQPAVEEHNTPRWDEALHRGFAPLKKESIDFGVMEKADTVRCVRGTFSWSDVGGWPALRSFLPVDDQKNAVRGRLKAHEAFGNLVFCDDPDQTVALVNVDDLVVVRSGDVTLITRLQSAENIKHLVANLETKLR